MKYTLSIRYYAGIISATVISLFVLLGLLTYTEVASLQFELKDSNRKIAGQELQAVISDAVHDIDQLANEFSDWQEVSQQLHNPVYYAYWHNHRALQAGVLPSYITDVAIYLPDGKVLSKLDTSTLPTEINPGNLSSFIEISENKLEQIAFSPVINQRNETKVEGYIAIRADLNHELVNVRQYNYLDRKALKFVKSSFAVIQSSELIDYAKFELRPNPLMKEIMDVVLDMLVRMALVIGLPMLLLYPLVNKLIARPLENISQHIDQLNATNFVSDQPEYSQTLGVTELIKVRESLNEYHQQLYEVHSSLDDKNKELWNMAHHDSLTDAFNRRAFDDHWASISELFDKSRMDICLAIFDVNSFKAFNDSYGHHIGDKVLVEISSAIKSVLRKGEKLYRLGGDEFACLFVNCDLISAKEIARRCEDAVTLLSFSEIGIREPVRISIGLSHMGPNSSSDLADLKWQADIAMYSAKQPGKTHIAYYTDEMKEDVKSVFSSKINNIVYEAITDGLGICMYYQPVVNLENHQPDYYEALLRIETDGAIVSPVDVFQLVEARRLEVEMDAAILQKVYSDLKQGRIPEGTGVSINVSGKSIVQKAIVEQLEKMSKLKNRYKLVLEITETALITQIEEASSNLHHLRRLGFMVALDDFGSGYSSVRYLGSMPVDIVKFDITLIHSLQKDKENTIVRHLSAMISESGHKLVAEGIETAEMDTIVSNLEFSHGQGYFYGKPSSQLDAVKVEKIV